MSSFLKKNVSVLLVWLGQRLLDNRDLEEFRPSINYARSFFPDLWATSSAMTKKRYKNQLRFSKNYKEPFAEKMRKEAMDNFLKRKAVDLQYQREINRIGNEIISDILRIKRCSEKMATIVILSPLIAEAVWYPNFSKKIRRAATGQFFYEIVYGTELRTSKTWRKQQEAQEKSPYEIWEVRAAELGMAGIYFDSDAPSNGGRRLSEFVCRIVGADLKEEKFPGYSISDIQRMAWHINQENFNWGAPKQGSIPKYKIGVDNRPIFAVEPI